MISDSPWRFNGKEYDAETGNYYYGARYYDPKTSIWLSVDPLAEKYPSLSPYAYVANNPINIIDPNGKELVEITIKTKSTAIKGKLKLIVDKEIAQDVKDLVKYAIDNDINVHFNSSFRSAKQQQGVQKSGTTPAKVGTVDMKEALVLTSICMMIKEI